MLPTSARRYFSIGLLVAFLPFAVHQHTAVHHPQHHLRGCHTARCDRKVGHYFWQLFNEPSAQEKNEQWWGIHWAYEAKREAKLHAEEAAVAAAQPQTPEGTSTPPSSESSGSGAAGGLPECTWKPESGGSWTVVNSSSGAAGKFQITPETWSAYGQSGSAAEAPPALQEKVASEIWAKQGRSAWTNC